MITRYGDRARFLTLFNPDLQMKVCKDTELCLFGDAPVLSELNMAYGEMTATMWLVPQLYDLSEYCGAKEKLQGKPLEECASVIATDFYYLKVSELMLFFHRFKSGRYGRFYGSIDPLIITTSLREFIRERNNAIHEHEEILRREKEEESRKNAITYDEYVATYGKPKALTKEMFEDPTKVLAGPKKKKEVKVTPLSVEYLVKSCKEIIHNVHNLDRATWRAMRDALMKHTIVTPEEYLKQHGEV